VSRRPLQRSLRRRESSSRSPLDGWLRADTATARTGRRAPIRLREGPARHGTWRPPLRPMGNVRVSARRAGRRRSWRRRGNLTLRPATPRRQPTLNVVALLPAGALGRERCCSPSSLPRSQPRFRSRPNERPRSCTRDIRLGRGASVSPRMAETPAPDEERACVVRRGRLSLRTTRRRLGRPALTPSIARAGGNRAGCGSCASLSLLPRHMRDGRRIRMRCAPRA
jgi:hypothetical protein